MPQKKNKKQAKKVSYIFYREKYQKLIVSIVVIILFLFLFVNILYSQLFSPLYSTLINEEKPAVVAYLKKIRYLPEFSSELKKYKNIYGASLEEEVFSEEWQRKKLIQQLEKLLDRNSKARDVLLQLSQLYKQEHNQQKTDEYNKRAKEVDPVVLGR